jgi:hypothetical protein
MSDLLDIGAAKLDPRTNALLVQAKTTQVSADADDAPDIGDAPMMCALGVTAFPYPADEHGNAQGIKSDVPGTDGIITAARDTRTATVTAELGPGETCVHSTGPEFDSRLFLKDKLAAIVVSDSMSVVIDEKNQKITISCFGAHIEASKDGGCYMSSGGAMIQVKDGVCTITGQVVLGGRNPIQPLLMGPSGVAGVPVPGVFAGA